MVDSPQEPQRPAAWKLVRNDQGPNLFTKGRWWLKSVVTSDGQWIFVSLDSSTTASNGIAVLHREGAQVCLLRVLPLPATPLGLALTRDNRLLLVADYTGVVFVDAVQARVGTHGAVLGSVQEKSDAIAIEVSLSRDEAYAFVANENDGTLGVINLQRIRMLSLVAVRSGSSSPLQATLPG